MATISLIFTALTGLLHLYFFVLEAFLWTKPIGMKTFKISQEFANASRVLAANQGVYNCLLGLGLLLSFFITDPASAIAVRRYCLGFVIIVGCYGAYSLRSFKVLALQALPALIALATS